MLNYLGRLKAGKIVLWCYFIWYLAIVCFYFDATAKIWTNALGISLVIGTGLVLSVATPAAPDRWQLLRLYLMPFCVSSFSSLIKGQGFFIVIPPRLDQVFTALACCALFVGTVLSCKWFVRSRALPAA